MAFGMRTRVVSYNRVLRSPFGLVCRHWHDLQNGRAIVRQIAALPCTAAVLEAPPKRAAAAAFVRQRTLGCALPRYQCLCTSGSRYAYPGLEPSVKSTVARLMFHVRRPDRFLYSCFMQTPSWKLPCILVQLQPG
eukprot:1444196-Pleurochrysis_carterae.AAC.5